MLVDLVARVGREVTKDEVNARYLFFIALLLNLLWVLAASVILLQGSSVAGP